MQLCRRFPEYSVLSFPSQLLSIIPFTCIQWFLLQLFKIIMSFIPIQSSIYNYSNIPFVTIPSFLLCCSITSFATIQSFPLQLFMISHSFYSIILFTTIRWFHLWLLSYFLYNYMQSFLYNYSNFLVTSIQTYPLKLFKRIFQEYVWSIPFIVIQSFLYNKDSLPL